MGEKNLWSKISLIVVLVGMCAWQLWPPQESLKKGIDLGGGHSLLFEIDDSGLDAAAKQDLAQRVMSILKDRIDPQGNRNLIWRPIGQNRLEIQMPRPPEEVGEMREAYDLARQKLADNMITRTEILSALVASPEQQKAAFDSLIRGVESRQALFEELMDVDRQYDEASARLEEMRPADTQPTTQPQLESLYKQVDDLLVKRQELVDQVMETNLNVDRVVDLLSLGKQNEERQAGIVDLKKSHPSLADQIDTLAEAYDDYAEVKGALDDPSDLMRLLRGAGELEFRILAQRSPSDPQMLDSANPQYNEPVEKYMEQLQKYGPRPRPGDNYQWFEIANPDPEDDGFAGHVTAEYAGRRYVLSHSREDMGLLRGEQWELRSAAPGRDQLGRPAVNFALNAAGASQFGELTQTNLQRPLCIFLDGKAVSAANIQSRIMDRGQIHGNFSMEEVNNLVNTLNAGVLPARLKEVPLQEKSIGPALGETNRTKGQAAVVYAFAATIVFMFIYYAYCGVIADIALLMNLVITLGVMSFLQATFTLPGIAGLVLTLGMAVDANVLIYERIREELQRGVSVRMAVKLGYEKAFSAILDSNVTTIIIAVILGSLGSEEIKGFGLTLGIGLVTSMFTALFVTRQFFHVMVPASLNKDEVRKTWLTGGILGLVTGLFMALGYATSTAGAREESTTFGLGVFLLWLFGTMAFMLISLWIFRMFYKATGHQKNNRLPMMKLFSKPNINWMAKYKTFWAISSVVIVGGIIFESMVDPEQYLDIEFLGGTGVQMQVMEDQEAQFLDHGDEKLIDDYIVGKDPNTTDPNISVGWLRTAADAIAGASVTKLDRNRFRVVPASALTGPQMKAILLSTDEMEELVNMRNSEVVEGGINLQFTPPIKKDEDGNEIEPDLDAEFVKAQLTDVADRVRSAANKLRGARVQMIQDSDETGKEQTSFEVITTVTSRDLVAQALLASMGNILKVTRPIEAKLVHDPDRAPEGVFPVKQGDNTLADVIGGNDMTSVSDYKGGLVMVFEHLDPPQSLQEISDRLREMRFQSDFEEMAWRVPKVVGLERATGEQGGKDTFSKIAIMVKDTSLIYVEGDMSNNATWMEEVAQPELQLTQAALASERSLQRVTKFEAQIATEATQKAVIAIILAMLAIAGYLWMRFGSVEFGLAGIIALYHDVAITLSAVMACHHLHDTAIGKMLMLEDFKIDLAMIAAFLTIVGYSINDTIVIFDRVRENRGRLATVSPSLINNSLNQTLSRTLMTSFTTMLAVVTMYIFGGSGIHGFAFAMIVGGISGIYSTIAIATPMVLHPRAIWITTIFLAAVTAMAMASLIASGFPPAKYVLFAIIIALALFGLFRQFSQMSEEKPRSTSAA